MKVWGINIYTELSGGDWVIHVTLNKEIMTKPYTVNGFIFMWYDFLCFSWKVLTLAMKKQFSVYFTLGKSNIHEFVSENASAKGHA